MKPNINELTLRAAELRRGILEMDYQCAAGHIGGALSSSDVLAALFFGVMSHSPERFESGDQTHDRFILSKGHCSDALYNALSMAGYFPIDELGTYCRENSRLSGHPTTKVPGVEICSGALGHGLSVGTGLAKALCLSGSPARVFVLMGDGELAEGSVWEAAMAAAHYKLSGLTAIIDRNGLQIGGSTEDVMALEDLAAKWRAFGWNVTEADGHDIASLVSLLDKKPENDRPNMIIAKTIKGKGISFMENNAKWHHGVPSDDEYITACGELDAEISRILAENPDLTACRAFEAKPKNAAKKAGTSYIPARQAVTDMLTERAKTDERIVVLTSDARGSASLGSFVKEHPARFVEVGIAEQNEIGLAAGLALGGKIPFVCAPACFLSARSYEQVKVDMAYSGTNVKVLGVSGGASYAELGQTHHSLQDIAVMRSLPGMSVVIPADAVSARALAEQALDSFGPYYIRVGRAATPDVYQSADGIKLGKASVLREGNDACVIASGVMVLSALEAAKLLEAQGISLHIIDMHTIKPLDEEAVQNAAKRFGRLITVEEHVAAGGLGSAVCELLSESGVPVKVIAFPDENAICGSAAEIYRHAGLDAESIAAKIKAFIK